MAKYDLGFHRALGVIYCRPCQGAVGQNFRRHLLSKHGLKMDQSHQDTIKALLAPDALSNNRESPLKGVSLPLSYLACHDGQVCDACGWCCIKLKSMKAHLKASPAKGCTTFSKCKVQSWDLGSSKSYFQVSSRPLDRIYHPLSDAEPSMGTILMASSQVLRANEPIVETVNCRSYFYRSMGWMEPAEQQSLRQHAWLDFFKCPQGYASERTLKAFIAKSLESVSKWNIFHLHQLGSGKKALYPLETAASRKAYCNTLTEAIFFTFNHTATPLKALKYRTTVEVKRVVEKCEGTFSKRRVVSLMRSLFTEKIGAEGTILVAYLRAKSLRSDCRLVTAEEMGRICSRLIYGMKVFHYLWHSQMGKLEDMSSAGIDGVGNSFPSFLFKMQSKATSEGKDRRRDPNIIDVVPGKIVKIGLVEVALERFQDGIISIQDAIKALLHDLATGYWIADLMACVEDSASNRIHGYAMTHKDQLASVKIIEHIVSSPALKRQWIKEIAGDGVIRWNEVMAGQYLQKYDKLCRLMLVLVHLASGMPARAPELATYTLTNGPSSQRSVMFTGRRIFFVTEYSKTNNIIRGGRRIARIMDEESSQFIVQDLLYIRPFVRVLMTYIKHGVPSDYQRYYFVHGGRQMSTDEIRVFFAKEILDHSGQSVSFSQYRHIAKYMAKNISSDEEE